MINRYKREFAILDGRLDGGRVDALIVNPRSDVQLIGGDFVNSAKEDTDDERDDVIFPKLYLVLESRRLRRSRSCDVVAT